MKREGDKKERLKDSFKDMTNLHNFLLLFLELGFETCVYVWGGWCGCVRKITKNN